MSFLTSGVNLLLLFVTATTSMSRVTVPTICKSAARTLPPPIVYTIAGSDSGGGAGIQADLLAIHSMNCHGCSAITCLTAQNSCGVSAVHTPPVEFLRKQLEALKEDLPPRAIKIGMLATKELVMEVASFLKHLTNKRSATAACPPYVVVDPVMITTSGQKLISDEARHAMVQYLFPHAHILTPNKFEAESLLGRQLTSPEEVEQGAKDLLALGVKSVLIKGGHLLSESSSPDKVTAHPFLHETAGYAQDYFLSSEGALTGGKERLCDGCRGVWLRSHRYNTEHTHGTGCTLSSAIASALAIGHQQQELVSSDAGTGAARAIQMIDACCLAKAYVTAGIERGMQLGTGPGPVAHTHFPSSYRHFPTVALFPQVHSSKVPAFLPMSSAALATIDGDRPVLGKILPIVDTVEWVKVLSPLKGIDDIQLRIKNEKDPLKISEIVTSAQSLCNSSGVRLWINDHWKAAISANCFGIHLGQEDLATCAGEGGLEQIRKANLALGISTHSYAELAAAAGMKPSYISLGPVFATSSKKDVAFDPQGLVTVSKWRELIDPDIPLVAIGGINDAETAKKVQTSGADCLAVISAVTQADDVERAIEQMNASLD